MSLSFQNLSTQQTDSEIAELEKRGWERIWEAEKMRKVRKMGMWFWFLTQREKVKKGYHIVRHVSCTK